MLEPFSSLAIEGCLVPTFSASCAWVIDGIGNGLGKLTRAFSALWGRLQNGYVRAYALSILLGVVAILSYFTYLALR